MVFLSLLIWQIILAAFQMLNHPCISRINLHGHCVLSFKKKNLYFGCTESSVLHAGFL